VRNMQSHSSKDGTSDHYKFHMESVLEEQDAKFCTEEAPLK
jgi:hypothetical protein